MLDIQGFEAVLADRPAAIQQLARGLRELILSLDPQVWETPWPQQGICGYGIGPRKQSEHYCYIGLYAGHVNLGFNHGSVLADVQHRLAGTGKRLRHVSLRTAAELSDPALTALLREARAERCPEAP